MFKLHIVQTIILFNPLNYYRTIFYYQFELVQTAATHHATAGMLLPITPLPVVQSTALMWVESSRPRGGRYEREGEEEERGRQWW
jgi:tellurite resistance protein TehA-like permease